MKIDNSLYAPASYWQALPSVRAQLTNGCGPAGWKIDLVPDSILGVNISEACNIHDWMYTVGCTIANKDEADRVLLNNMLRLINSDTGILSGVLRGWRRRWAWRYYEAVHRYGGPAFWHEKNRPEELKGAT